MKAIRLGGPLLRATLIDGLVLAHDVAGLRKGRVLSQVDQEVLDGAPDVHVVQLEEGELHESEAAVRFARTVAGQRFVADPPFQGQVRIHARRRGLFTVDAVRLQRLNSLPGLAVFTRLDLQAVQEGDAVAGCKVIPLAVPESVLEEAARLCHRQPAFNLRPFQPLRTFVAVTERLKPRARELFLADVGRKLGWHGAEIVHMEHIDRTEAGATAMLDRAIRAETDVLLVAGASAIDPLDPALSALHARGGRLLRQGLPGHPGSMAWVARLRTMTVLGVASCAGFGNNTILDLVISMVYAGMDLGSGALERLGAGGLVEPSALRRFPPYSVN